MKNQGISCLFCDQTRAGVFCSLERTLLSKLDGEKTVRRYVSGNILFYEGAAPLAVYCVHDGLVKLTKSTSQGRSVVIRLLGKREIAGFRAVIANEPYAATAEVVEPADVCIIPADTFRALLQKSSEFKSALLRKLAAELRISEERVLDQTVLPARVRIARLLVFLADQTSPGTERQIIQTRLLRQDLAEAVGVTPQTFSRILHQFNAEGIVKSSRNQIVITAPPRLQVIASRDQ